MDELQAVRDLFGRADPPDREVVEDRRARLLAHTGGAGARRSRPRSLRRPLLISVGLAVAAVSVTLVVPAVLLDRPDEFPILSNGRDGVPAPTGSATPSVGRSDPAGPTPSRSPHVPAALTLALRRATEQAAAPSRRSWRVRMLSDVRKGDANPVIIEGWVSSGVSPKLWIGSNQSNSKNPGKVGPSGRYAWAEPLGLEGNVLAKLPSDSGSLRNTLLTLADRMGADFGGRDATLFTSLVAVLTDSPAHPGTRRGAVELLSSIPGIRVDPRPQRDPLGRAYVLVTQRASKTALMLDPATGAVLGRRTAQSFDLVLDIGWTDAKIAPPRP